MKYLKLLFYPQIWIIDLMAKLTNYKIIKQDYYEICKEKFTIFNFNALLIRNKPFRNIVKYRISSKFIGGGYLFWLPTLKSIEINCKKIGGGLKIPHNTAVIVANSIGEHCQIGPNVVVGKNNNHGENGRITAIIGNNVKIHANSTVFGGITIGDNVIIGAGSVVNKSIPENSMVIGNPFRIIKKYNLEKQCWEKV